jgi:hypothetical protein
MRAVIVGPAVMGELMGKPGEKFYRKGSWYF